MADGLPGVGRPGFSRAAMREGFKRSLPLQVALMPFGLVCGIVAQGHGLSLLEAVLMSGAVYAGSAQLLALAQWGDPVPIVAATAATLVVNLRLALMAPLLEGWLNRVRGWRLWGSLFLMADQNWAMAVAEVRAGRWDLGFLFGSGVMTWFVWVTGTGVGYVLGAQLSLPAGHPVFFAAIAVFVALLTGLWRGREDLVPWVMAGATALAVSAVIPGTWYIVAGALAGAVAGMVQEVRR